MAVLVNQIRISLRLSPAFLASAVTACAGVTSQPELPDCVVPVGSSPTRGPANALVTAVEFGDFECPYCGQAEPTIQQADSERPGVVRWVWKNLPLASHSRALPTAIAAECANDQNQFWEMHDLLYLHQDAQSDADLLNYAQQIGLDIPTWQACLSTDPPLQRIAADEALAQSARVTGTPSFFFNGIALVGAVPLGDFLTTIDAARQSSIASDVEAGGFYSSHEGQGCQ
jgi:protein-disulfide isomerase